MLLDIAKGPMAEGRAGQGGFLKNLWMYPGIATPEISGGLIHEHAGLASLLSRPLWAVPTFSV